MSKIFKAMTEVMKATNAIGKDQKNVQQGFSYRGIDSVYNTMHQILADHGIFMTPEVLEKTREERINQKGTVLAFTCLRMKYTFWTDDGSSVSCVVEGEGMDSGDKSTNKAMAVAHKYAMLQTFCIPTAETKDPDAETHVIAATPAITLEQATRRIKSAKNQIDLKKIAAEIKPDCEKWLSLDGYEQVKAEIHDMSLNFKQTAA